MGAVGREEEGARKILTVSLNDRHPIRRTHRVRQNPPKRRPIHLRSQRRVAQSSLQLGGQDLGPDGARDGVAQCGTDRVGCQEEGGDHSQVCNEARAMLKT